MEKLSLCLSTKEGDSNIMDNSIKILSKLKSKILSLPSISKRLHVDSSSSAIIEHCVKLLLKAKSKKPSLLSKSKKYSLYSS